MLRPLTALASIGTALALLSVPLPAQDLFLGSRTTQVSRNDPLDGSGALVGLCGGVVQSMEDVGGQVFVGDQNGNVYNWNSITSFLTYAYTSTNDAKAMLAHGNELLVGGSDGSLLRYDPFTGVQLGSVNVGMPVLALTAVAGQVVVGSQSGVLMVGDPVAGGFQFLGTCGNNLTDLVTDGGHVLASDEGGLVWRFDIAGNTLLGSFALPSPATSLAWISGDLLAAGEDGQVRRVERNSGAVKASFAAGFAVDAMTLVTTPEPGVAYCFGASCPCGNDDPENACANSTGFGAGLVADGSASVAADNLELTVHDLPKSGIALFYMGPQQQLVPFGDGLLCAGAGAYPAFRFQAGSTGSQGLLRLGPGIVDYAETHFGTPGLISAGSTWNFQAWYRDPVGPCGSGVNTSNAYTVQFQQ